MVVFDKAFINGKVYSMKEEGDTFQAMLVHQEKILETGSNEEISRYPVKEVIDLKGKPVLPGFIDI